MFEVTSTLPNFIFGQFPVARKLIINGGTIRPIGLLLYWGYNTSCVVSLLTIISKTFGDICIAFAKIM